MHLHSKDDELKFLSEEYKDFKAPYLICICLHHCVVTLARDHIGFTDCSKMLEIYGVS